MKIEWDEEKRRKNLAKHGIDFTQAFLFDLGNAFVQPDTRSAYGEARYQAYSVIGTRLHMMAFTLRGDVLRVISLRKANKREVNLYAKTDH
jgi:uncharacterized protein